MDPERFGFLALQALLEKLEEACLVFDEDRKCRFIGKRTGEIFGIETAVYVGRTRQEIFTMLASSADESSILTELQRSDLFIETAIEVDVVRPKPRKLCVTARKLEHLGELVGSVIVFRDITRERAADLAKKELEARIQELAPVDELTGVANWRRFHDEVEREHGRALRHGRSYAVLRVDIDQMRDLNESFGQSVGDRVLEELADLIKSCQRAYDTVGRYEADEFVLLLPDAGIDAVMVVGERIIRAAKDYDFRLAGDRPVTVAVGGAVFDSKSGESWADVVRRAGNGVAYSRTRGGNSLHVEAPTST